MMDNSERKDSCSEGSESYLHKQESLNSALIVQIISDEDKFLGSLRELNDLGVSQIANKQYQKALLTFQKAEKILEYAASCGRSINRNIIIGILRNIACAYQRLWDLDQTSNYLQAIIYNLNAEFDQIPTLSILGSAAENQNSNDHSMLSKFIHKKVNSVLFYLQFSAINSQLKRNKAALGSATNALDMLKLVCEQCDQYERQLKLNASYQLENGQQYDGMLRQVTHIKNNIDMEKYNSYIQQIRYSLEQLKKNKHLQKNPQDQILCQIADFDIGSVMQIIPLKYDELTLIPKMIHQISYGSKLFKVLYYSVCLFSMATENRLIAYNKYEEDQDIYQSIQFRKSEILHINSINILIKFVPRCQKYLAHLLKSYHVHYKNVLVSNNQSTSQISYQNQFSSSLNKSSLKGVEKGEVVFQNEEISKRRQMTGIKQRQSVKIKTSFQYTTKQESIMMTKIVPIMESIEATQANITAPTKDSSARLKFVKSAKKGQEVLKKKNKKSSEKTKIKQLTGRRSSGSKCGSNSKHKLHNHASFNMLRNSQNKNSGQASVKNVHFLQSTHSMVHFKPLQDEIPERSTSRSIKKSIKQETNNLMRKHSPSLKKIKESQKQTIDLCKQNRQSRKSIKRKQQFASPHELGAKKTVKDGKNAKKFKEEYCTQNEKTKKVKTKKSRLSHSNSSKNGSQDKPNSKKYLLLSKKCLQNGKQTSIDLATKSCQRNK